MDGPKVKPPGLSGLYMQTLHKHATSMAIAAYSIAMLKSQ